MSKKRQRDNPPVKTKPARKTTLNKMLRAGKKRLSRFTPSK